MTRFFKNDIRDASSSLRGSTSSILPCLHNVSFKGHLPRFIQNFMTGIMKQVRVGCALSQPLPQVEGVPQGRLLSCSLFALTIIILASCTVSSVECSLYVDSFALHTGSASLPSAERKLQLAIKKSHDWTTTHGFAFSWAKTVFMHLLV